MIYIKYGTFNDVTKVLDWSTETAFNELEFKEIPTVDRISGKTLRGRRYSHRLHKAKMWNLVISSDELADPTKYAFIISLNEADAGKFSTWATDLTRWDENTDNTIEEFTIENDRLSVEFIENHKSLPHVSMELLQKVSS